VNYKHFLNKSNSLKNKNCYRLESKKKKGHNFLFFSAASVAILTGLFTLTLFLDTDGAVRQVLEQTVENTSKNTIALPAKNISSSSHEQNIPLDLPEIGYGSEVLSESVSYFETKIETKTEAKLSEAQATQESFKQALSLQESPESELTKRKILEESLSLTDLSEEIAVNSSDTSTPSLAKQEDLSKQQINESVTASILKKVTAPETVTHQDLTGLSPTKTSKTRTVIVKSGDTLSAIFKRLSLSAGTLHRIVNSSKQAKQLTRIKPGQKLIITFDDSNGFQSLRYDLDRVDTLIINKETDNAKFVTLIESKEIDVKQQFATATISNSLFASGNKAGLSSAMIMKLAQLFGWDIDFALDIRKGDSFAVLFEEKYINDKKIGNGDILSAEFVNRGKTFKAIRYTDASGHTDYYSEEGLSMRKAFLRTPVEFSRISSRFSSGRKHPVLNKIRAHKGVDYAASRGTPIKSVGDGKVIFKGRKGGYGRVIILQHGSKYTTLYAHMKSYNRKIKQGSRVKQGQIIGYVGSSGLATGPHLHYEFRMNGVHRNPLTVPLPSASPIAKKYRNDFQNTADTMISQLKSRKTATVALKEQ
jgi:murein DD-endopeptidase MepM/ murein hydrolase activator NlpD